MERVPAPGPTPILAVADDDEMHAELVSTWLEHRGFRVLRFGSGEELLDWASASARGVDALLLDVDMPGRDGFESCLALRSMPRYAATPAVFISSASHPAASGAPQARDEFIRKDGEMLERLSCWLERNVRAVA
jgi:CheY-like chemotaxis protein